MMASPLYQQDFYARASAPNQTLFPAACPSPFEQSSDPDFRPDEA